MRENNYDSLTPQELRELFLNNTINPDFMGLEEYEKLFGYETDSDDPNGDILSFCANGLEKYEKYNMPKPPIEKVLFRGKKRVFPKTAKRIFAAVAVLVAMISLTQIVSLALGFNMFGFIFNWSNKDAVEIKNPAPNLTDEKTIIEYTDIRDIDADWIELVPPYIIENYEFDNARYRNIQGDENFVIYFKDDNSNQLSLSISNSAVHYIEKDDGGFTEEIVIDGTTYTVFTNTGEYKVVWENGGYLYYLNTFLPIETVREIIGGE